MAIITQFSRCPICKHPFGLEYEKLDIFGLSASGFDLFSDFFEFNDVGIHQNCFRTWEKAKAFVEYWNENMKGCENYKYIRLYIMPDGSLEYEYRSKIQNIPRK